MKKLIPVLLIATLSTSAFAFDYVPKNVDVNPFENTQKNQQKVEQAAINNVREIKNLTDYFKYLPLAVHKNWTPYQSNTSYEVQVQFRVKRDGSICEEKIVNSTNPNANESVLNAVKSGAPYKPLPESYPNKNGVTAQVVLEYRK